MATARANWHLDLPVDDSDPFDTPVEQVGVEVDLRGPAEDLHRRLARTVSIESALFNRGVTCPIKDEAGSCCSACPVRHSDDSDPLSALCAMGMEQERLATELAARKHAA